MERVIVERRGRALVWLAGYRSIPIHIITQLAKALEFVEQGAAADAEGFGRFGAVEIVLAQSVDDGLSFDLPELPGIGAARGGGCAFGGAPPFGRQMLR